MGEIPKHDQEENEVEEEEVDNGLGVFIRSKALYHGSGTPGIKDSGRFKKAGDTTVGDGVYLTSEKTDAVGYALQRSHASPDKRPTVYEASIENLKLADLRKKDNVARVMDKFKVVLLKELEVAKKVSNQRNLRRAIDMIEAGKVDGGNIREVTFNLKEGFFSDFVKSLGYDGLITMEGGEAYHKAPHNTYLIFDTEKARITKEEKL